MRCLFCKMKDGINWVQEAAIHGGPYWSCAYCGSVFECQAPLNTLPGKERTETTGRKERHGKY